jgi:processive 1,2-diacylglycerol beta-glucosyltransferase
VAIDETRAHLEMLGLPAERITVSGIPIDPLFSAASDMRTLRMELGLDPGMPVLLVSGGALGVGPAATVVNRLLLLKTKVQCVVVCGKSEKLREAVESVGGMDPARFHVLGYTTRMHDYMKAADLFVGKPGGLTTSETLACGLPMAIVSPIPGQEERNSDHLLEEGIAVKCNEMTTLPYKIDRLLQTPGRLEQMRRNALAFSRPDAARVVVDTLLSDDLPRLEVSRKLRKAIAEAAVE